MGLAIPHEHTKLPFVLLALLGLVGLYASLIRMFERNISYFDGPARLALSDIVRSIASRTIAILAIAAITLMCILWPGSNPYILQVLVAGGLKAAHWVAVFWLVRLPKPEVSLSLLAHLHRLEKSLGKPLQPFGPALLPPTALSTQIPIPCYLDCSKHSIYWWFAR